jgi:hypothetical protein
MANQWTNNVLNALNALCRPSEWLQPPPAGVAFADLVAIQSQLGVSIRPPTNWGEELLAAWAKGEIYSDSLEAGLTNWTARLPKSEDVAETVSRFTRDLDERIASVAASKPDPRVVVTSDFKGQLSVLTIGERPLRLGAVSALPEGHPLRQLPAADLYSMPARDGNGNQVPDVPAAVLGFQATAWGQAGPPGKFYLADSCRMLTRALVRKGSLTVGEVPIPRSNLSAGWRENVEFALSALRHPEAFLLPPPYEISLDDLLNVRQYLVNDAGDSDPARDAGNRVASRIAGNQPREALATSLKTLLVRLNSGIEAEVNAGRTWAAERRTKQAIQDRVIAGLVSRVDQIESELNELRNAKKGKERSNGR